MTPLLIYLPLALGGTHDCKSILSLELRLRPRYGKISSWEGACQEIWAQNPGSATEGCKLIEWKQWVSQLSFESDLLSDTMYHQSQGILGKNDYPHSLCSDSPDSWKMLDYRVAGAEPGKDKVIIESYVRDIFSMSLTFYFFREC